MFANCRVEKNLILKFILSFIHQHGVVYFFSDLFVKADAITVKNTHCLMTWRSVNVVTGVIRCVDGSYRTRLGTQYSVKSAIKPIVLFDNNFYLVFCYRLLKKHVGNEKMLSEKRSDSAAVKMRVIVVVIKSNNIFFLR